ncbi:hypothetical protein KY338_03330 [Candidatus Woesearchaeota archaeon]|nr:hypothetical protein [Candidatus Woesearchaeota archaeon]MBW3005365.1 hypothetical protein [Candidatus Woesearchaeota archaeon]
MGYIIEVLIPTVWQRLIELLEAPAVNPSMIWMITPLIVALVLMTFYFGKWTRDELGWNTAVGNSIVLLFVSIDLFRYVFNLSSPGSIINYELHPISTIICIIVAVEAVTLMLTSFFKALPKSITFFICAPLPVNLQAYIAISIVYTNITLDWFTLLAVIVLFIVLYFFVKLLQFGERTFIKLARKQSIEELEEEKRLARATIKEAEEEKRELKEQEKKEKVVEKALQKKPSKKTKKKRK